MRTNFIAVTAGLAATTSAFSCTGNYFSFFNRDGPALSYQRLDPSLFPGTTSPHLHAFDGGNGLGASTSYQQTQESTCSTARVKSDKSLYWRPSLFWNGNGTGFYRVPEKNTKIYYKYGDGDKWANVTEFPEDFNMMAGNPTKRADGDNPAMVRWGCHNPNGRDDKIFANGFPTGFTSCDYGFASEVTFPSCWNGEKTDPKNPHAHMAYPTNSGGVGIENCPTTHRAARFPTIFIEFWYDISAFDNKYSDKVAPWVISNGDPTGYGFHADFLNGWKKGVLAKATAEKGGCDCGCGCGQAEMEKCFGTADTNRNEDPDFQNCVPKAASISSAESAMHLDNLPGCNPLQSGPADATVASGDGCTAAPVAGGDMPSDASKTPVVTPSPSGKASSLVDTYSSAVVKDEVSMVSISIPNKQQAKPTPAGEYGAATSNVDQPTPVSASEQYGVGSSSVVKATPSAGKPETPVGDVPSLTLASTPAASKPSGSPAGGEDEDCKTPVYVTVTPTVYVTVGSNATSCGMGTVTKTMTEVATITIPAQGGIEYGSY